MRAILTVTTFAATFLGSALPARAQQLLDGNPAITYWQLGEATADHVIVVLHGGPAMSHDYLRPEWDRLAGVARVVYYDQRGCGQSGTADSYGWQDHVADLARLIAAVSPDKPVVLAGSSWGASLALLYLNQYPENVEALILSGTPGPTRPISRPGTRLLPKLPSAGRFDIYRTPELPRWPSFVHPMYTDIAKAQQDRAQMDALLAPRFVADCPDVRTEIFRSLVAAPTVHAFDTQGRPVLLFADNRFDKDFGVSANEAKLAGLSKLVVGGGHDPWFQYPDAFFGTALDFLNEVWGR